MKKLMLSLVAACAAAVGFGATLYVSSTATGGGDGSELNPYTMSEAWKNVKANDTIQLADGTYVEEAVRGDNACFTVRDKANVTFQGNTNHPENVIIDFNGTSNRGFYSPNQPFTIRGITFQNKKTNGNRGTVAAGGTITGAALVENCRFVNITTDQTSGDGRMGTVFTGGATANYVFRNCEIKDCNCYVWGVMYVTAGSLTLSHCTVNGCYTQTSNGSVAGINGGTALTIEDSDFVNIGSRSEFPTSSNPGSGVVHVNDDGKTVAVMIRRSRFWNDPTHGTRFGGFAKVSRKQSYTCEDCEFYDFAIGTGGGGLFCADGTSTIAMTRCVVSNSTTRSNSGVVRVNASGTAVTLNDCHFMDCRSTDQSNGSGGLVYVLQPDCTLAMTNCVCEVVGDFEGAQAYNGGQININDISGVTVSIERCEFRGCSACNAGGAIFSKAKSGSLTVRNSLFSGCDITTKTSGAVCIYTAGASDVKIENCTFADNCPHGSSSNLAPLSPTSSTAKNYVKNCVFWNNRDKAGEGTLRVTSSTDNTVFENCVADVSGLTGVTKLSASPFKDAANGDYTLPKKVNGEKNPCLEAGVKLDWMTADSLDLAGHPRLRGDNLVDLGCYEYYSKPGLFLLIR